MNLEQDEKHWTHEFKAIVKSKRALLVFFLLLGLVFGRIGINFFLNRKHGDGIPIVNTVVPEVKSLDENLSLPGNMEAIEQASLFAHVGGYLKKIYVDEGDKVKEGQILADIDAPEIVDEYSKLKADFQFKTVTRDRYLELVKQEVISQQEFDSITAAYDEAKAKFSTAASNIAYTHIKAPFDGSIARRFKYPGDLISVSSKDDQNPIFLLVNEKKLRVVINVPQVEISNISSGALVDIRVDSFPTEVFKGMVSRIDALLTESTKTERVLIDIENADGRLKAGMFGSVILHFKHRDNAITVPTEAVEVKDDKSFVFLFQDGKVKEVPVVVGITQDANTEIIEGVKPTDHLILHGLVTLSDGMRVKETVMKSIEHTPQLVKPGDSPSDPTIPAKQSDMKDSETASAHK
jgi:membrane fusion protein (multidrug efflux system)